MAKRQKVKAWKETFGEVLGGFDLLPKLAYAELETEVGDAPSFMFWGLYLVRVKNPKKIVAPFCIVDNLDSAATAFVIKDTRVTTPIVINAGPAPAITSVAELQGGKWYHAGLAKDRTTLGNVYDELRKFATSVELVLGVLPFYKLTIHTDDRVKEKDHVYAAIAEASVKKYKK